MHSTKIWCNDRHIEINKLNNNNMDCSSVFFLQWLVARLGRAVLLDAADDGATPVHFAAGKPKMLR